ncbi:MAG: tetratricopeptide repeat protein [Saprospiraceae bacterium]|nr:tetratricopeptide repeat protein [Candidatus Vicinibacter affinis]
MKYFFLTVHLCFFSILYSQSVKQNSKGVSPIGNNELQNSIHKNTYAVVVGISDYQDKDIPDLRFADKDAEAFANFLRSPAGGSLDGDHLKVLTNKEATMGQFAAALDWLWEVSKEGDLAIIYFSGHGDVEKKSITQPGYLLCWDAPSRVYMGGGAFALPMFQDVVTTLSAQNKAKVVVITDACRSGKLAGSSVGGSQVTGSNLARQYANEIKILSCQPEEYSIEGEQWGGGRGAFSYNLVNALYGLADGNNDLSVTLQEVGRYLEDHVTAEVAPVSQVPMVMGNRSERLATVDAKLLSALRSGKTSQMQMLSPIETRGIEDEVLASVDTTVRELYRLFKKALKDKVFLVPNAREPAIACADAYYERLIVEPKMQRLHSTMARNYAAALQDDAQQTLNEWLKTSQEVSLGAMASDRLPLKVFTEKVKNYPRCLERAAELLGSKHYMYAALKARQYFFEGYLLANSNRNPNAELGERALLLFRQSLKWQQEQPQVYWQISQVFGYSFRQPDSLEYYTRKALKLYPNWTKPILDAASVLIIEIKQYDRARRFMEMASLVDSDSEEVLYNWASLSIGEKKYSEAERQLKKALALDSINCALWNNLGYLHLITRRYDEAELSLKRALELDSTHISVLGNLGAVYNMTSRFSEAEPVLKKAIAVDSTNFQSWVNLSYLYQITRRYSEAEPVLKKAIVLDSTNSSSWSNLGSLYQSTRRYIEAEQVLKKAIMLDSTYARAWNNLGSLYNNTGRSAEAEPNFKKAIALDSTFKEPLNNLGLLLNNSKRYSEAEPVLKKAISLDSTLLSP